MPHDARACQSAGAVLSKVEIRGEARVTAGGETMRGRAAAAYRLDDQVGFLMRQANQRHLAIFARRMRDLTPTQFATLAKAYQRGPVSQNDLGRQTAMDAATMKGVIDRLAARGLVSVARDPGDRRRRLIALTDAGRAEFEDRATAAQAISEETLAPLTEEERAAFLGLLRKMIG